MKHKAIVRELCACWLKKDDTFSNYFAKDASHVESYGSMYQGRDEIENKIYVEWYFKNIILGKVEDFRGCSSIEFNENHEVILLKEFASRLPNDLPYQHNKEYTL